MLEFDRKNTQVPDNLMLNGEKDTAPPMVTLFHELAHIFQLIIFFGDAEGYRRAPREEQDRMNGIWYTYKLYNSTTNRYDQFAEYNTEKFATHYENALRASMNLPLREFYTNYNLEDGAERLLHPGTTKSIYHYFYTLVGRGTPVPIAPYDYSLLQKSTGKTK